jgi:hypothetical protein
MTIGESWLARNTQQAFFMRFHVVHPQLLAAPPADEHSALPAEPFVAA